MTDQDGVDALGGVAIAGAAVGERKVAGLLVPWVGADLHARGLAAAGKGEWAAAVELFAAAVEAAPGERVYRSNLALGLLRAGRAAESVECYRAALALEPGHAVTLAKLGRALVQAGQVSDAVAALEQAALALPDDPDTANALGAALASAGRMEDARTWLERAVRLDPAFGEAWRNLGFCEASAGRWAAAAAALGRAVETEPPSAELWYQLGVARAGTGDRDAACHAYRRALELDATLCEAWNNLGHQLAADGDTGAALKAVKRALSGRPHFVEARYNLGVTLQSMGRLEEARAAYQLVLAAAGAHADALNNLGGLCLSGAAPALAVSLYERALVADPAHPEARWNLGLAQLSAGDWERGWSNYESRAGQRKFPMPAWQPEEEEGAGRSVLLWCEQGLGDGVQFLRYVEQVRARGAWRIVVECPAPLAGLFALAEGVDEVVVRGQPRLPPVDCQAALMSLPYRLKTRLDSVPAPGPAYRLPESRRAWWRQRLAERDGGAGLLKVGVVWGGNPANHAGLHRSMPLHSLAEALGAAPGVTLVNLQHGAQRSELDRFDGLMADWEQDGIADTAALVAELDLVITVDTLMAHLAGTLGRPVWVLTPFAADWRWMTGRDDSPWYPSLRLFRQTRRDDWGSVVERVAASLAAAVAGRAKPPG